jgi:carbon-monoxide dehydrogenase small subunit
VAVHHLLDQNSDPDDEQIKEALSGNICRCTGYGRILDAVKVAARGRRDGVGS